MFWKHIGHHFGKYVKMINNMILLENHQVISKVNGMLKLRAKILAQAYLC